MNLPLEYMEKMKALLGEEYEEYIASFEEGRIGSLEKGKDATFVIFESPVRSTVIFQENFAKMTFIKGKKVYSAE